MLLVVLGVLVTAWLVGSAGERSAVLVLLRDVPYGATITVEDVGTAEVSVDAAVRVLPAADRDAVVGQVAAADLVAGSLLSPGQVAAAAPPAAGQALVGVAVPATRMPAGGVRGGDRVLVVQTPQAGGDLPVTTPVSTPATVVRVGLADLNGVSVVDVTVPSGQAASLAAAAATGRVALVLAGHGESAAGGLQ